MLIAFCFNISSVDVVNHFSGGSSRMVRVSNCCSDEPGFKLFSHCVETRAMLCNQCGLYLSLS